MQIELKQMKFYAYHGVMEQERKVGNNFLVDIGLETGAEQSVISDDLSDTISYADVFQIVQAEMQIPSKLLEHVCGRIISAIHERWETQVRSVDVRLAKLNPPFGGDVKEAAVRIKRVFQSV